MSQPDTLVHSETGFLFFLLKSFSYVLYSNLKVSLKPTKTPKRRWIAVLTPTLVSPCRHRQNRGSNRKFAFFPVGFWGFLLITATGTYTKLILCCLHAVCSFQSSTNSCYSLTLGATAVKNHNGARLLPSVQRALANSILMHSAESQQPTVVASEVRPSSSLQLQ